MVHHGNTGLRPPSVHQGWSSFVGLSVRQIWRTSGLNIMSPGDLDLCLWPWNWCALLPVGWTTFPPILVFLWRFILDLSANTCHTHHVTLRPWPWRSLRCSWCESSCSVNVPSLNFVGLPVSINRSGDLDLWPLALKLVCIIARRVDNLPTNFGISRSFHSRLIGQHLPDTLRDLATLTFDLRGHGSCRRCGFSFSVTIPSLKFVGLPSPKIWRTSSLSINRHSDLDLWPLTLKLVRLCCPWGGQPSYWFWCFWDVSLSTYRPTPVRRITWPCDLDLWHWRSQRLSVMLVSVFHLSAKFEVRRPFCSEDIVHLLCEH